LKVAAKPANLKESKENANTVQKEKVLDIKNTVSKFLLDQTVGAAFNIPLFIGIIGMLKGQGGDQIWSGIQRVRQQEHGFFVD
jgi:protein Mpv17